MIGAVLATAIAAASLAAGALAAAHGSSANCARTATGLVPLKDLGKGAHEGFEGGLYPGGANAPAGKYLAQGMTAARAVVPRAADGKPSPGGRIVLLSIGMSFIAERMSGRIAGSGLLLRFFESSSTARAWFRA